MSSNPPDTAAARDACDEHHGASQRAPMDHPSRKVNYDVLALDTTIGDAESKVSRLIATLRGSGTDPATWDEVVELRRALRSVSHQIVHVLDANREWSHRAAHNRRGLGGHLMTPPDSAATPDPSTEAGRREMDRQAGLAQEVSDAAEAWLSGNVAVPSPAERADYRNGATVPRGHEWVEVSAFAGRFCSRCGVDEDDQDDVRWDSCQPEAAHAAD